MAGGTSWGLLVRALAFALAFMAWVGLVASQPNATSVATQWIKANYEAKESALRTIAEPRVLLVGGSSAVFGLRAGDMTGAFGVPVVNFGNHAGLGLAYNLERADRWVRPGDTVVLALEYELFGGDSWTELLVEYVLADDRDYFLRQPWALVARETLLFDTWRVLQGYGIARREAPKTLTGVYYAPHLDGYGDTFGNLAPLKEARAARSLLESGLERPSLARENRELIARQVRAWQARGARVIAIAAPSVDLPGYHEARGMFALSSVEGFYSDLGIPMPLAPASALYPVENFFDSHYHLDLVGARMHTARVIEAIRPFVATPGQPTAWHPPAPTHALAEMANRYKGWESREGIAESDFAGSKHPTFLATTPGRVVLGARTAVSGPAHLRARVAPRGADDALRITIGRGPAWECRLPAGKPVEIELPAGVLANGDLVSIEHRGPLEFEQLTLAWGVEGNANEACGRMPGHDRNRMAAVQK